MLTNNQDMPYVDGDSPPKSVVDTWLGVCRKVFKNVGDKKPAIGIHCVAGLGRAPVLVAIALIESGVDAIAGMSSQSPPYSPDSYQPHPPKAKG